MAQLDPNASLETIAETLFGELELDYIKERERRGWTRALIRWYQFNLGLLYDNLVDDCPYQFPGCLSGEQYHSFRALREWWRAEYQPAERSIYHVLEVIDKCDEIKPEDEADVEGLALVLESLETTTWPSGDVECGEPDAIPYYNFAMRRLFDSEFYWSTYDHRNGQLRVDSLRQWRHIAKLAAYTQKLKMAVFDESARALDVGLKSSHGVNLRGSKADELVGLGDQTGSKYSTSLLLSSLDMTYGPPIRPCRWLPLPQNRKTDMPYYLWDRHKNETVRTSELECFVEYTAVSHTWGRWRTDDEPAHVAGVPWPVPLNRKFDVQALPRRLARLDCGTRYLWFDLFCIPQDRSPLATVEIARQAIIFQNARRAVAWLRDVDSLRGLQAVLLYMLYKLLRFQGGTIQQVYASWMTKGAWDAVTDQSTNLLEPGDEPFDGMYLKTKSWFTSLWTLQELCLRPDMWLCSEDWGVLSLFETNEPLPFGGILAIWKTYESENYQDASQRDSSPLGFDPFDYTRIRRPGYVRSHIAFAEFLAWIRASNLDKLLELSWVHILSIGDKRVCTSRRAEAIMSALGATDWYHALPQEKHEDRLILGKYPIAFLEELKNADPGSFFGRFWKVSSNFYDADGLDPSIALQPMNRPVEEWPIEFGNVWQQPRGSMLPFSDHGAVFTDAVPYFHGDFTAHDTLRHWQIREDGSVRIKGACVLASSSIPLLDDRTIIPATIIGIFSENEPTIKSDRKRSLGLPDHIDLEAWVHSRSFEVHALVCTYRVWTHVKPVSKAEIVWTGLNGIILARTPENSLVQIGTFTAYVKDGVVPPPSQTDWVVA